MIINESIEIIDKNIVFFCPSPINNKSICVSLHHYFDTQIEYFSLFSEPNALMPMEFLFSIL